MKQTLSYAIVGTGMMGHEHLRNLRLLHDNTDLNIRVRALIDPDQQMRSSALDLAVELGFSDAQGFATLADAPMDEVDAVVIVSPNFTHHKVITELLPLNKAILAEKPLCTTVEHCDDLVERLDTYSRPFWVAMEYRYMPPTARFLERLGTGEIGNLKLLSIKEHRYPFLPKVDDWNRFSEKTGGTLVEKCCHHFDLMRLMTGAEPVRIYASGAMDAIHLDERYDGKMPDIIDNAYVIVDFDNGTRGALELCMFADGADPQEQLTAIGELGKLDAFIPGPDRFWPDAGERPARVVFSPRDQSAPIVEKLEVDAALAAAGDHHGSTYYQHVKFAAAVLQHAPVEVTALDGAKAVRMGAAAQESIRTGQAINLTTF